MTIRRVARGTVTAVLGWLIVAGSATVLAQTPAPADGLTLPAAIERALAANPTIAAARLQRPVGVAGVGVARERPNPELAYESSRDAPRQAIGATLPIELGGKRQARIAAATAAVSVSEADLDRVIAEVRNDVRRAYFAVIAADRRVEFTGELQTLATRARDAARARVQAGDVPQADLTQASLALASSENDVAAARGEAAAARAELNAFLGQPPATTVTLSDAMTPGALMTLDAAVAQATSVNAALQLADRQIEAQTAKVRLAKAEQTPDLTAGTALTYDAEPDFAYGWRLSGAITLPIFTTHRAGVLVEEAELARLKGERDATLARMTGAIAAALARAESARDRVARYDNDILPLALEAERQAEVAYTAGQTGLVALIESLRTARETRQAGLQAAQDFQQALADLELAIGAAR
jgi:cobalt-zinc-cadmium efflux system outer membrane protein